MKRTAVYPGSFDPITFGHLDIIKRACVMFERVIVAIVHNPNKSTLFSLNERLDMIRNVIGENPQVQVGSFEGLLVDFLMQNNTGVVVRGLRAVSDMEYEFQMAHANRELLKDIETIFLMPSEEYTYLSSSIVKEIARLGGDTKKFAPESVGALLKKKFKK
ncbi:MAG: pantetheine-phosphate adenylyltransferase [Elusimicrobiota bacterium]